MSLFEANTICRLCLRVDENVNRLDNEDHEAFIESIIQLKHSDYVSLEDLYVCYICYALLTKSYAFAHTVWNTQEIICDILKNTDIITKPIVQSIDRNSNGLNPITLTRVVVCENKFKYESCTEGNTSSDAEELSDSKRSTHTTDNEIKKEKEKSEQNWECKKKPNKLSSSSDESERTEKYNLDEVEVEISNIQEDIQISDVQIESSDLITKDVIEVTFDELKEEQVDKEKQTVNKKRPCPPKPKDGSTPKRIRKRKKSDEDYKPDSTSHSEDSDHDLYDDEGKRVRVPKRFYPMKCAHCDFIIEEARNHYRHYQHVHPQFENEYPYKKNRIYACSVCGKLCASTDIARHEGYHITRKLKCRLCPKVFSNELRRYRHMTVVHPKRKLVCDYCSKSFKTRREIIRHIRTHTGSKPFKCHICGDGFAHSGNRLIHIRSKHQNYKYAPENKQEKPQKVRKSNKRFSSDTEISSDETTRRRTKIKKSRKSKNQSDGADVRSKKKRVKQVRHRNKGDSNGIAIASELDSKTIRGRRKPKQCDIQNKNHENAETDSEDEVLAVIKTKQSTISSK